MKKTILTLAISLSLMSSPVMVKASVIPSYYQYHYYSYYSYNFNNYYNNQTSTNAGTTGNTNTASNSGTISSSRNGNTSSTGTPSNSGSTIYSYKLKADESYLAGLVNQERSKNNIKSLNIDTELSYVAHLKAEDMLKNNYFSHTSPIYGSPFDMMNKFGIKYYMAGENIAENTSVLGAHVALMNSSGHRANILNARYTDIGIGVVKMPNGGVIVVEMFIAK